MIEVNGVIYRNLEEQVQKNKDDIENLKNQQSGDDSDIEQIDNRLTEVETTLTEITPDVMRALKTPISAPNETKIVAVDSTNSQEMLSVGTGLVIENHQLKSTGGTEIIDNLTSSSTTAGLSANQGRVLDNKITTLSKTVNSKANQSSLDLTNQNVSQNTNDISTINSQISNIDSQTSTNTEDIEFLQSDVAGKTNVTINNVHQDYVNFSSDPQTQLNTLNTNKAEKDLSNVTYPQVVADGVAKTGAGDRVIERWISSDGQTWYEKYASGWKRCGGIINNTVTPQGSVTLPITFSNEKYVALLTVRWDGTGTSAYGVPLNVRFKTTTGFQYYAYVASGEIQWTCEGY